MTVIHLPVETDLLELHVKGESIGFINKEEALTLAARLVKWAGPDLINSMDNSNINSLNPHCKFIQRYWEIL